MNHIALAIKEYIAETGRTQSYISKKTGIPSARLNLSLNGKRKMSVEEYESICNALCVSPDKFLSNSDETS